jgi:FKBP-type peptidyl-prolyl cis-trans isomerase
MRIAVLAPGKGSVSPRRGDRVKVHYTGWTTDGTEFDSSRRRGAPATFVVGQLVEGWNLALMEMTAGARWKLTIPPSLGYGAHGSPPAIGPNATLVFDMELLAVHAAPPFRKPDPAAQKVLASGVKYEVLEAGSGGSPGAGDAFEIAFALYDEAGTALDSTEVSGQRIRGRGADMLLPFLKDVPLRMKEGDCWLIEVPPEQAYGARAVGGLPPNARTIWRLRLVRAGKPGQVPAFRPAKEIGGETTASGLRILLEKPGAGETAAPGDEVVVHYAGWLDDGTLFDSSHDEGLPATFRVGDVIPGWNEALGRMKPGAVAWLVIPPDLAYGSRGTGRIPPGATLTFRVELFEVRK